MKRNAVLEQEIVRLEAELEMIRARETQILNALLAWNNLPPIVEKIKVMLVEAR